MTTMENFNCEEEGHPLTKASCEVIEKYNFSVEKTCPVCGQKVKATRENLEEFWIYIEL